MDWRYVVLLPALGPPVFYCLAIYAGLRVTLLAGACLYLGALTVVWLHRRSATNPVPVAVTATQ